MNKRQNMMDHKELLVQLNHNDIINFLNCSEIAVIFIAFNSRVQYITSGISKITGITIEDRNKSVTEIAFFQTHNVLLEEIVEKLTIINESLENLQYSDNNIISEIEVECDNKRSFLVKVVPYRTETNDILGLTLNFCDITERKQAERKLAVEKEKFNIITQLADSAIWEYDIETKELRLSKKLEGRFENSNLNIPDYRRTMLGWGLIYEDDIPIFLDYCDSMDRGDDYFLYEFRALCDIDDYMWMRYQGSAIKDINGKPFLVLGKTVNIDEEKKDYEKRIKKTQKDSLTGLYNRLTTKEMIEKCLERGNSANSSEVHGFLILDIDNFKKINNQYGHLYGDSLLEKFSDKLNRLIKNTDVVGRIGGDEFVVFIKGVRNKRNIIKLAESIIEIVEELCSDIKEDINISISIGISIYPYQGRYYDELLNKADFALFKAKKSGSNSYYVYDSSLEKEHQQCEIERHRRNSNRNLYEDEGSQIEKRLISIAFDIINETDDLSKAIEKIFFEMGKYFNLSRIYVFEDGLQAQNSKISYEWIDKNIISSRLSQVKNYESAIKEHIQLLESNNGILICEDIKELNMTTELIKSYEFLETKALLQYALYDSGKLVGSISYEDCKSVRKWSKPDVDTITTMTKMLGTFIIHMRNKQALDNEIFFTQAMLNNQRLSNYAIRPDTYELLYFSEYTENLFPNVKLGETCYKSIFGREVPCDPCPIKGLTGNYRRYSIEAYDKKTASWYSKTASLVELPNGQKMNLICSSDVTGFIERMKSRDTLTGLLTLSKFEAEAMKLIANNEDSKMAIIYFDIDKFKNINDEWGYSVGNEVLTTFSGKIKEYILENELFCRISSDRFLLLLYYEKKDDLVKRIRMISEIVLKHVKKSFPKINLVISSGLYFLTMEDKEFSIAIDKANLARQTIKGGHKSNFSIYDDIMHKMISQEKKIENQMYEALKNNEFIVYMQPKIDLVSGLIAGAEALVRWKMPDGQILNPSEFIPTFEKNGFIDELDFYVYEETLKTLRHWLDIGKRPIIISLNVSRVHIKDSKFIAKLDNLVKKYNIPSNLIEFEITENIFFNEQERLIYIMNSLRKKGFLISIDDFGSGYSSLNLLKMLPIDILKLDREFFMGNNMDQNDKIIISGIISLAKSLGLKVVSEGVETEEQAAFLRESCCDMAQGFLFYKPLPMEEFIKLIY